MNKAQVKTNHGVTTLSSEIEIRAPKLKVWEVLSDVGGIEKFHPLVKKSKTLTIKKDGLGAKRYCELLPMGVMEEQVVEWQEGQSFVMKVVGGKMLPPHKFMEGIIELEEKQEHTLVRFSFRYELKYGLFGRLMDALLIKSQFRKAPPQYVQGLKNYIEDSVPD